MLAAWFKAISLIKQFREIGIDVVMIVHKQAEKKNTKPLTIIDDGNGHLRWCHPSELERFMMEKGAHLLVGGVKERLLAYKNGFYWS